MPNTKKPKLRPEAPPRSPVGGVLPEVVDYQERRWTVEEGEPDVDYRKLVVRVPSGEDRRFDRARTLAKVRVSPEPPDWAVSVASPKNIDAMEDIRCGKIVSRDLGLHPAHHEVPPGVVEQIRHAVRKGDQQEAARLALAHEEGVTVACTQYDELFDEIAETYDEDGNYTQQYEDLSQERNDFQRFIRAAGRLVDPDDYRTSVAAAKMLDDLETVRKPGRRGGGGNAETFEELVESSTELGGPDGIRGVGHRSQEQATIEAIKKAMDAVAKAAGVGSDGDGGTRVGDGVAADLDADDIAKQEERDWDKCHWGTVEWDKPPLVRNLLMRKTQRTKRPTDEGAVIRNMNRWFTDKRVFTRKKKIPGGTLLVDISGSMSLSPAQVEAIIDISPMATIVTYSGASGRGVMRLIAKNGRRADNDSVYETMGGNEIDGPALKWLAQQAEPRVWVSDGIACTAIGEMNDCVNWCRTFAKKHRIVRMPSADKAVDLLGRLW